MCWDGHIICTANISTGLQDFRSNASYLGSIGVFVYINVIGFIIIMFVHIVFVTVSVSIPNDVSS